MTETRPMTFINHSQNNNSAMQAAVRAKVTKTRLPKDIKILLESKTYSTVLAVKDKMEVIWIKIKSNDGFYRNQEHIIEIKLEASNGTFDYPFTAPLVKFLTPIHHVNISYNGSICLSILKGKDPENPEGWTEACSLHGVISSILLLLDVPNIESPWNKEAAKDWMESNEGKKEEIFIEKADKYYLSNNYKAPIEEFNKRYAEDNDPNFEKKLGQLKI